MKDEFEMQLVALPRSDLMSREFQLDEASTSCFRWPSMTRLVILVNTFFFDYWLSSDGSIKLRLTV